MPTSLSLPVPYSFEVLGWEDYDGDRHSGEPSRLDAAYGVFVHLVNPNDMGDQHHFWVFTLEPFDDWDDWYDLIDAVAGDHGMELV